MGHYRWVNVLFIFGVVTFAGAAEARRWVIPRDFTTIQEAIDSEHVVDGDKLIIKRGRHAGAVVTKSLTIVGRWGAVIDSGPVLVADHPCIGDMQTGFMLGFDNPQQGRGSSIRNLFFDGVEFPVYGKNVDYVEVTGNVMVNPVQGVTIRGGSGWQISHNWIDDLRTANGGGIGVFVTDRDARAGGVAHNYVSYNSIVGTLNVSSCDGGGYSGGGVFINADFRNGSIGAEAIYENLVSWNRIDLVSDISSIVDVVGIALEDSRNDEDMEVIIFDNYIMFNNLYHLDTPMIFAPSLLEDENNFYMNWMMQ